MNLIGCEFQQYILKSVTVKSKDTYFMILEVK